MDDRFIISREDSDAIFAALRGVEQILQQMKVSGLDDQVRLDAVQNNLDSIRLRLTEPAVAQSATRN